uniref:Uncharacterized protein n=1 Tax=Oryza punctata TaxID=4537 RepID=A0A0E0MMI5_ORYPU
MATIAIRESMAGGVDRCHRDGSLISSNNATPPLPIRIHNMILIPVIVTGSFILDSDELRQQSLLHLLMYQQSECESNIPSGTEEGRLWAVEEGARLRWLWAEEKGAAGGGLGYSGRRRGVSVATFDLVEFAGVGAAESHHCVPIPAAGRSPRRSFSPSVSMTTDGEEAGERHVDETGGAVKDRGTRRSPFPGDGNQMTTMALLGETDERC